MSEPSDPSQSQIRQDVPTAVVVVDTDAFSKVYVRQQRQGPARDEADALRLRLQGKIVVIATQSLAELEAWPFLQNWGASRRQRLMQILGGTTVVPVSRDVVDAFVTLTVESRAHGHPLAQKQHVADRWVAATAIALDRPLLAVDGGYRRAPRLALLP